MKANARWLLLFAFIGLVLGLIRRQPNLAGISLAVVLWIVWQWIAFQTQMQWRSRRWRFTREVNGISHAAGTLWAGRKCLVRLRIDGTRSPVWRVLVRDIVPHILELNSPGAATADKAGATRTLSSTNVKPSDNWQPPKSLGYRILHKLLWWRKLDRTRSSSEADAASLPNEWLLLSQAHEVLCEYSITAIAAGKAVFPGVRLRIEDSLGLFRGQCVVPHRQEFRILSDYYESKSVRPSVKRHNSLPKHGIHRLQRSGTGPELLELREYVEGDPPKSIAWKASARRQNLMTRQYESEVPVRVQFLIAAADEARVGGYGRRLIDQMNYTVASVAKSALAVGDPVRGVLIDDTNVQRLPWSVGDMGFLTFMRALSEFSHRAPPPAVTLKREAVECSMAVCYERYPELLENRYQFIPFSFFGSRRERFRLANAISAIQNLSTREHVACWYDDAQFARRLQTLLFDAGLPWMHPVWSERTTTTEWSKQCVSQLVQEIGRAVYGARDNEVFVILADPNSIGPYLSELTPAVKLAVAKHHRVALVCPTRTFSRPSKLPIHASSDTVADLLWAAEQSRNREVAQFISAEFARLGVPTAFSAEREAISMVIAEMDLARDGRRSVGHGGSSTNRGAMR